MTIISCPFCGTLPNPEEPFFSKSAMIFPGMSVDKGLSEVHPENIGYSLMCSNIDCGSEGPIGMSKEEAVEMWNGRRDRL